MVEQGENARFKVEGVVVNSVTGKPIPRVLVQIAGLPQSAQLTGSRGEFSFRAVPAGQALLSAAKPGFLNKNNGSYSRRAGQITVGPDTGQIVWHLEPEAVISGTVTGKDEEPVEGIWIDVLVSKMVNGHREISPVSIFSRGMTTSGNPVTDEGGNFRFSYLPAGKYYVAIRAPGNSRSAPQNNNPDNTKKTGYPLLTYYPGVTDFDAAMALDVSAGQNVVLHLSLKQIPMFPVVGTVSGIGSLKDVYPPVLVDHLGQQVLQANEFNHQTGAFTFKAVPAGTYTIRTQASDQNNARVDAARTLNVDGPVSGFNLSYGSTIDIPLIVREEFTQPPPAGTCQSAYTDSDGKMHTANCSEFAPVMVDLKIADTVQQAAMAGIGLRDDPSSRKLSNVSPGRYRVTVFPRSRGYVASARSGGTDLLQEELVVPDEGGVPPIEIVLRDDIADVEIEVNSEKPAQIISVVLVPRAAWRYPIVQAMLSGSKLDTNVPPGEYTAFALDSPEGIDTSNGDMLARYAEKGTHITVLPNSKNVFSLELMRAGD